MTDSIPRYIKLGAGGAELAADAPEWVAVRDARTGLDWAREAIPVKNWKAKTESRVAAEFEASDLAGGGGWQIPTRAQLITLVDDTRYRPAIDVDFFPDCPCDWFWTCTVAAPAPGGCAWFVIFGYGDALWFSRNSVGFVRAVRASQYSAIGAAE